MLADLVERVLALSDRLNAHLAEINKLRDQIVAYRVKLLSMGVKLDDQP